MRTVDINFVKMHHIELVITKVIILYIQYMIIL